MNVFQVLDGHVLFYVLLVFAAISLGLFSINEYFKKLHLLVKASSDDALSVEIIIDRHDRLLKCMNALKQF